MSKPSSHSPAPQPGGPDAAELVLTDALEGFREAETRVMNALTKHGYPEASRFAVRLALEEAVVNAFKHGSRGIPNPKVQFAYRIGPADLMIRVKDPGPGFKPETLPDPTAPENIERPGGRGVMLMRAFMTRVEYNDAGNQITMIYEKP